MDTAKTISTRQLLWRAGTADAAEFEVLVGVRPEEVSAIEDIAGETCALPAPGTRIVTRVVL